jgi:hypothetical protein
LSLFSWLDRQKCGSKRFPITMHELNDSVEDRISDHPPITVDLPLTEPTKLEC